MTRDYAAEIKYWTLMAEDAWKLGMKETARGHYATAQELKHALKCQQEQTIERESLMALSEAMDKPHKVTIAHRQFSQFTPPEGIA